MTIKEINRQIKEKVSELRKILIEKELLNNKWNDKQLILMLLDIEIKRLSHFIKPICCNKMCEIRHKHSCFDDLKLKHCRDCLEVKE